MASTVVLPPATAVRAAHTPPTTPRVPITLPVLNMAKKSEEVLRSHMERNTYIKRIERSIDALNRRGVRFTHEVRELQSMYKEQRTALIEIGRAQYEYMRTFYKSMSAENKDGRP